MKGMTLMELLVSVALISVIMIFMYKLIADVRNEKKENDKFTDNIIKVNEIMVAIQNTVINENVTSVNFNYDENNNEHNIEFFVDDVLISKFNIKNVDEKAVFNLTDKNNQKQKWIINGLQADKVCYNSYKAWWSDESIKVGWNINIRIPLKNKESIVHVVEIPYYNPNFENFTVSDSKLEC